MRAPRERFTITLEPVERDSRPPILRLRGLLKAALRAFGMRCIGLKPNTEPETEAIPPESSG